MRSHRSSTVGALIFIGALAIVGALPAAFPAAAEDVVFCIGTPDARAAEFGLASKDEGYSAYLRRFSGEVEYVVGKSDARQWPYIHPAPLDRWAGGRVHVLSIRFTVRQPKAAPLYLILGLAGGSPNERSKVVASVNGKDLPGQTAPAGDPRAAFRPEMAGKPETMIFDIPPGAVRDGENTIAIRLEEQSWVLYDYVALSAERRPLALATREPNLLARFRAGPMAGVDEIVFAVRALGEDPHWYANFGSTLDRSNWRTYGNGGRLCRLHLSSGKVAVLLDDPKGGIRDPVVHYGGRKVLFSYRKGDGRQYHLFEIEADGTGLQQLTDGPYDDIEPIYLPDGDILFVSSRCRRVVNCHTTDVAVLHRCRGDGSQVRALSSNNEHDNTPWLLPSGQVVYTRWEYVDRDQMSFHHLWTANPDGARQMVFYGNQQRGTTMIDAKPVPGSRKIVASFSPGHGTREHDGFVTLVDPRLGPDAPQAATSVSGSPGYRDPWAFSEEAFLAASRGDMVLMDGSGETQTIYRLSPADVAAGLECHEPRPLVRRTPEPIVPIAAATEPTGRVFLADVHRGRNMQGVAPGEIKKLLVLETLPKPMNYSGGMEPLSYGGTFTLERVLGTVPVEPDGSAYAELPALRSLFFVALDGDGLAVKRMQSFLTLMPGETTSCVGCHEPRTTAPAASTPLAGRRPPSRIEPIAGVPDVFDFPRDIQPILTRLCLPCHDCDRAEGGLALSGDRGPVFSISYYTLTARNLVSDGRNGAGNHPPRSIGSSASHLFKYCDGSHYQAQAADRERLMLRLWIDSGAAYPGTYAALGTGMVGGFEIVDRSIRLDRSDLQWPSVRRSVEAIARRCGACHDARRPLPLSPSHLVGPGGWGTAFQGAPPWVPLVENDVRCRWSRDLFYNLSRPEKSMLLLAPLAKAAGGLQRCGPAVFTDAADPDYRIVLAAIEDARRRLQEIKRFDMPGFRPRPEYVAQMKRYGILPADLAPDAEIDVYAVEQAYWRSLQIQ